MRDPRLPAAKKGKEATPGFQVLPATLTHPHGGICWARHPPTFNLREPYEKPMP